MAFYEVVFIARQDLSVDDVDNLSDKLSTIVSDHKGELLSKEYWGLKKLAYIIKKNVRGHYILLNFDAPFEAIAELKRVIGFNENIIRSDIFRLKNKPESGSLLMVSEDAKSFKEGNVIEQTPSAIDDKIDKLVINNLI
ncbi:MAG: small subunit ribosomal protein S6 [Lentimonas sp.]|jgi:small subunit ribosomal protein S6